LSGKGGNGSSSEPINEPLTDRQLAILTTIKQSPFINRDDLAGKVNISLATLKRELTTLRKNGYISRRGSNKNGSWLLLKKI
jgi:DNA-binding MarR family transcriptional regulator